MKKSLFFSTVLIAAGVSCLSVLPSCKKDGNGTQTLQNQFEYSDEVKDIKTVACLKDDAAGTYSLFISPTAGITDLDGMLAANDYIKIVTSKVDGNIDLTAEGNSLVYNDYTISSENKDDVVSATLSVVLDGNSVEIALSSELSSGKTLDAQYNGTCISFQQGGGESVDVTLDKSAVSLYMGRSGDIDNYLLVMTNAEFNASGSNYELKSEGYALQLDLYTAMGESWTVIPDGEYAEATNGADHTYTKRYSGVKYRDAEGNTTALMPLSGPVTITKDGENYVVTANFVDENGAVGKVSYTGVIRPANATFNPILPQIEDDVVVEGFAAEAVYQGNVLEAGTGLMEINIYDYKFDNKEPNGYGITIVLFSDLFQDPKTCRIIPGEYKAASNFAHSTWMIAQEIDMMGMVFPLGTYVQMDDGTDYGKFSYAAGGKIVVTDEGPEVGYTIECDLVSADGYTIKASYTGKIPVTDMSDDNPDDGSTTLEKDLEMDLNYLSTAYCYPQSSIYIAGVGTVPVDNIPNYNPPGEACGYQFIELGRETGEFDGDGKLIEGDIIRLDLLVEPGQEDKITLGTYEITDSRYPIAFKPGVAPRGFQGVEGNQGTRWEKIENAIGNADIDGDGEVEVDVPLNIPSVKGYACLYSGSVTIEKADGGENWYTFTIDGMDVLKHKITGTWTGPVCLAGGTTPVLPSETKAFQGRRMPLVKDLVTKR